MPLSNNAIGAMNARETGEVFLPLVTIDHSTLPSPKRYVNNTEDIVSGGQTYEATAFEVSLPDQRDEGLPVLRWSADNRDGAMAALLRNVVGHVDVEIKYVMASTPDVIEVGPFNVVMQMAEYNLEKAGGPMTVDPVFDTSFSKLTFTPQTYPGLFA